MIINLDFDGTCVSHDFPMGNDIGAVPVLKRLVDNGHQLILFTMRSRNMISQRNGEKNDFLQEAIDWFKQHNIPLYGIQINPTQKQWTESPKSYAHLIIDDTALGCPLKVDKSISDKPFVDWKKVETMLEEMKLI